MKINHRKIGTLLLFMLGLVGNSFSYASRPVAVNDTGTRVEKPLLQMKWDAIIPSRNAPTSVSASTRIFIRLDVAPWRGKNVHLFLVFPPQAAGNVQASWTSAGRLLPGRVMAGERALVYSGLIDTDVMEDTWLFTVQADGRLLSRPDRLQFSFEIEADGL